MGASALAAVWLVVASSARYDVSLRSEARVRSPTLSEASLGPALVDTEVTPLLQLLLRDGTVGLQLAYGPRLFLRNLTKSVHPELQHSGRIQAEWKPFRGLQLFAIEGLTYGQVDSTELSPTGSQTTTPSVRYISSESSVGMSSGFGVPRLVVTTQFMWLVSGGLGETTVPFQQGPRLTVNAGYKIDPRLSLTLVGLGSDARFSTGSRASVLQVNPGIRYRFDPRMEGQLDLGVGYARNEGLGGGVAPDANAQSVLLPSAGALLTRRLMSGHSQSLDSRLAVRLTPFVDPLTARAYHRGETTLGASWLATSQLRFNADVTGALALSAGPQQGDAGLTAGLTGQWLFSRRLWMEAGFRATWSRQQATSAVPLFQWGASISLVAAQNGSL